MDKNALIFGLLWPIARVAESSPGGKDVDDYFSKVPDCQPPFFIFTVDYN